jgi:uncharacterized protein (TIGR03435 family)
VQFVSITDETDIDFVRRFLSVHPVKGWVAFDSEESTFHAYGIEGRPRTVLIDQNGFVRAITNPSSVTPQVLEDLLAGKSLNFPESPALLPLGLESDAPMPLLQVLIRPAAPVAVSGYSSGAMVEKGGRYEVYGMSLRRILSEVYQVPENHVDAPEWCSQTKYDYSIVTPQGREDLRMPLLKQFLEATFALKVHKDLEEDRVFVLRKIDGQAPKIQAVAVESESHWGEKGELEAKGSKIGRLKQVVQDALGDDVLDETGLTGRYAFHLKWDANQPMSIIAAVRDQLGLELVLQPRKFEHLVVDFVQDAKTW